MVEFEVFGKTRGFKLGTYTFKLINQEAGTKTVEEVFEKLKEKREDFACTFYWCCAKHWAMSAKQDVDFSEVDVADWLDELGLEQMQTISAQLFKTYITKNLKAPETGLELQSSNGKH
jgi:hypothetical protein